MYTYDTVTEAVKGLKSRGYNIDFNLQYDCIVCPRTALTLTPDEFEIVETHRFEGITDPGDEMVVFAIEGGRGEKGILTNAFGVYSDSASDEMLRKLAVKHTAN